MTVLPGLSYALPWKLFQRQSFLRQQLEGDKQDTRALTSQNRSGHSPSRSLHQPTSRQTTYQDRP